MPAISRSELQTMAEAKVFDAELLYQHGRFSNAYYLFGYGVEIGLKACVAQQFKANAFPDKQLVDKIFTHKLTDLVGLAGLKSVHDAEEKANPEFKGSWTIVVQWSEQARYLNVDEHKSTELRNAICAEHNGVWQWLIRHW